MGIAWQNQNCYNTAVGARSRLVACAKMLVSSSIHLISLSTIALSMWGVITVMELIMYIDIAALENLEYRIFNITKNVGYVGLW